MSVVINEFEVQVEPPREPADADRQPLPAEQAAPTATISPMDLRDVLHWQARRLARLRAH